MAFDLNNPATRRTLYEDDQVNRGDRLGLPGDVVGKLDIFVVGNEMVGILGANLDGVDVQGDIDDRVMIRHCIALVFIIKSMGPRWCVQDNAINPIYGYSKGKRIAVWMFAYVVFVQLDIDVVGIGSRAVPEYHDDDTIYRTGLDNSTSQVSLLCCEGSNGHQDSRLFRFVLDQCGWSMISLKHGPQSVATAAQASDQDRWRSPRPMVLS